MAIGTIMGAVGNIEIRLAEPGEKLLPSQQGLMAKRMNQWVVICHPHPKFGGDMNNKVATTLERTFQSLGYGTLIFNFRGVGQSEGEYDNGEGEAEDLHSVVDWLRSSYDVDHLILSGFSFGGYIALQKCNQLDVASLCTIAPAIGLYDFSGIEVHVPWNLIQGGQDEVICPQEVLEWVKNQPNSPDIYWRGDASHFFHKRLVWLKEVIKLLY